MISVLQDVMSRCWKKNCNWCSGRAWFFHLRSLDLMQYKVRDYSFLNGKPFMDRKRQKYIPVQDDLLQDDACFVYTGMISSTQNDACFYCLGRYVNIYDMIYDIWYMIYDIWYMIWYNMIWYDMIWYDMIWYDMIWYDMIWYDII
jgi:hypothetical protein